MKTRTVSTRRKIPSLRKKRRTVRAMKFPLPEDDFDSRPRIGTLNRTKSLLLAALRLWELKNGIHSRW
jgi:hypothetical protein